MPYYEYRCPECDGLTTAFLRISERGDTHVCEHCGGVAQAIVSRPSVHLSKTSKLEKLDPKYDKMVDKAMASNPGADPDRLLKKMRIPS